LKCPLAVCEL